MDTIEIDPVERLLGLTEVAERLGVHRDTIHVMVQEKRFPAPLMLGNRPRWTARQFNTFIAELRQQQAAEADAKRRKTAARKRARA